MTAKQYYFNACLILTETIIEVSDKEENLSQKNLVKGRGVKLLPWNKFWENRGQMTGYPKCKDNIREDFKLSNDLPLKEPGF